MRNIRRLLPLLIAISFWSLESTATEPADLASVEVAGATVELRTESGTLVRVSFLNDDLLRIQATTGEELTDEGSGKAPIVLPIQPGPVSVQESSHDDVRSFATPMMELRVHPAPMLLELRRKGDDELLWRELRPIALSEQATTQTLTSSRDEHLLGGGQQNGTFEFKGMLMEISYSGGWEEGDRPSPAPFYMSDRGYGVLRNTWSTGVYDFRSDNYLTTTHKENRFDAYYMVGESIHEVLDLYTKLTGRAGLLPRWAFGYGDADCYNDGDNVKKPGTTPEGWSDGATGTTPDVVTVLAQKYREHDMPGSWILPNDGYGCGYTELPEVVGQLKELGFRTGLWTENGVEKIAWEVGTAGTRVQKLDVAWTGKGYQWALDANHDAAQGFLANSDSRPFIWTVMGWAGIQRYAVTWTGDQSGSWDYIRWHVPTLIGSGLSGMNYSTGDVDGIFGGSPETFTRDLQWKCLTPVLMGMSGWSKVERKHPWWFEEPYRSINRRYLKLRQRLMPYLYTLAHETATTGAPMIRGLMWDHPEDPHAFDYPYQFFLGRELLVAPVYGSQADSDGWREGVYLPQGRWIDYWNGTVIDAGEDGRLVDIPVDLATLPVLVRAGAIIPMYPESLYDGQLPPDPLTLDVYPYGDSEFVLYEDDGNTRAYLDGRHAQQRFKVITSANDNQIEVVAQAAQGEFEGMLKQRSLVIELHTRATAQTVTLDGVNLPELPNQAELDTADRGWFYAADDRGGVIHVKTEAVATRENHSITVQLDPKTKPAASGSYPLKPAGDGTISSDTLLVVSRPAEEPGHPVENAFDGNPDTWFRTIRDQSVAYGPHELTLSLGGRRTVEGLRISPRNDKHWKYGQIRRYEVHMADVNGQWGDPIATGSLERTEERQEVRFKPHTGRLLRLRVLATHDDGVDPMVLGAAGTGGKTYDAHAAVRVSPVTISELQLLEKAAPANQPMTAQLIEDTTPIRLNGLSFANGKIVSGSSRLDFELSGNWHTLRAEAGLADAASDQDSVQFQVWGDGRLIWDSGKVATRVIIKPRIDLRGVTSLSLRTVADDQKTAAAWAEVKIDGYQGDTVTSKGG